MNWRNKYLLNTARILLGLIFLGSGIAGFIVGPTHPSIPEDMRVTTQVLWDSGIFQMIKITEIIAGIMFIFNLFPALAAIFVSPICVGVIVISLRMVHDSLISGIVISILTAYLGYAYWPKYKALFTRK